MPTQVYVGLAVTSHNPSAATTATFSNVTITGAARAADQMADVDDDNVEILTAVRVRHSDDRPASAEQPGANPVKRVNRRSPATTTEMGEPTSPPIIPQPASGTS